MQWKICKAKDQTSIHKTLILHLRTDFVVISVPVCSQVSDVVVAATTLKAITNPRLQAKHLTRVRLRVLYEQDDVHHV